MRKLRFSLAAEEDVKEILTYTLETWGERQFEQYLDILNQAFDEISKDTLSPNSRYRDELVKGVITLRDGHHIIFFRMKSDEVEVIRVLHERMDFGRHLK
jgi:toxin ParE1/3/4